MPIWTVALGQTYRPKRHELVRAGRPGVTVHFKRALGLGKNNGDVQNSEILKKHVKM